MVIKIINHSKTANSLACELGWQVGARYTNLRDVRHHDKVAFIDIDWKDYDFERHLHAVKKMNPLLTIARDIEASKDFDEIMNEAERLRNFCHKVAVVPKDPALAQCMESETPADFLFGYSTPTKYGGTIISPVHFKRRVHILGGRPDIQRKLADIMHVYSFDCNRFTYDARFGDYFDGIRFRPHPAGGYQKCLKDSILNINRIWSNYRPFQAPVVSLDSQISTKGQLVPVSPHVSDLVLAI